MSAPAFAISSRNSSRASKAQFDAKQQDNFISDTFATVLRDSLDADASTYVESMGIRWASSVTDQTLETTHLKVVPDMESGIIIFSTSLSDYMEKKLAQEWFHLTTLDPFGCTPDPLSSQVAEEVASDVHRDDQQYQKSLIHSTEIQESTSWDAQQLSHFQSTAASHGIHFMNTETMEHLAPLFPQLFSGTTSPPSSNNTLYRAVDEISAPSSDRSAWELATEVSEFSEEWSPDTSQRTLCEPFYGRLASLKLPQVTPELAPVSWDTRGFPTIRETLTKNGSGGGTTLAQGSSNNPSSYRASSSDQDQNEEDINKHDDMFDQSQLSEFEDDPGHKVWEWDLERQRWRKRGGTTEADWFPDFFA
ncbi:hypothetical protein G7Z17_g9168 [Cylindrodendrum hubeiense]|uniref:Uncharacterized protein n=1 Tax=Cylindrodendrum hubeiense TaxID=595255 RepID=A0A9P5L8D7_9HYPO|nr:hypothetical protein G7Z17_g9168 [Cylindrodendrum hubeiense]